METMNLDFAGNTTHDMHDAYLFNSDHSTTRPDEDDDSDDEEEEDDNATDSNTDGDPAIDQKVVHSPLPTDDGGKPKK